MTRNRAERRHHMVRLKNPLSLSHCRRWKQKASGICFRTPVFVLVGCVGIDAIIMVPAYRKFVQKHAMRIKGK